MAPSPDARHTRLRNVTHLARFLHAEDSIHEVPFNPFHAPKRRTLPYIYAPNELVQIMEATNNLRNSYPLRRQVYATLIGLIAATGLRISEALDLRFHDLLAGGVLMHHRPSALRLHCDKLFGAKTIRSGICAGFLRSGICAGFPSGSTPINLTNVSLSSEKCLFLNSTSENFTILFFNSRVHKSRIFSSVVNCSSENDNYCQLTGITVTHRA